MCLERTPEPVICSPHVYLWWMHLWCMTILPPFYSSKALLLWKGLSPLPCAASPKLGSSSISSRYNSGETPERVPGPAEVSDIDGRSVLDAVSAISNFHLIVRRLQLRAKNTYIRFLVLLGTRIPTERGRTHRADWETARKVPAWVRQD